MATVYEDTMNQIAVLAKAIPGIGDDRVFVGFKRFNDTENFEDMVTGLEPYTQGYFLFELAEIEHQQLETALFRFVGSLHFYAPKDTSNTLASAWALANALSYSLSLRANYESAGLTVLPRRISCKLYDVETISAKGAGAFDFGRWNSGGMEFLTCG